GTVDKQVTAQGDAAKKAGASADAGAGSKLSGTKPAPKGETSEGGVSVAAAVGVNVGVATTVATVAKGRTINAGGALKVTTTTQTDASAKADGSQVDSGGTDVGVGAAVALNLGVATSVASVADNSRVTAQGVTVSATTTTGEKNDFGADAKSGAGAGNVGVAGSLALNVAVNTTVASIEGDKDSSGLGASVAAGGGDISIEAQNASTSTVKAGADVKGTDSSAKVGVGASIGANVVVNTAVAEVEDGAKLTGGRDLALSAKGDHTLSTEVTGGAAGAKVSITPVVAATVAVNTATARVGESATALGLTGKLSAASQLTDSITTKATGQAQGDVAVGAALAATIAVDTATSSIERDVSSSSAIDLSASSKTLLKTGATAGAKGAKAAKKDADGKETPEAGTTVDEQKKNQLDFAKGRNDGTKTLDTDKVTPAAETPAVNKNDTPNVSKTNPPPGKDGGTGTGKESGKKVSVAAAIGVGVAVNQAKAGIGAGRRVSTSGNLDIKATTDTNYATTATGEAVSDDVGVAAAVALTATFNKTQATIGAGTTVVQAQDINILATALQNRDAAFVKTMSAEAVSGASGGEVAVAGALAVVGNDNETTAAIDEGATIGSAAARVGDITVKAEDTSKISAQARAGALSTGDKSKAGVGASFAVLLSNNQSLAAIGRDTAAPDAASTIHARSATVKAAKNRVEFYVPNISDVKSFSFDTLDPSTYLGSNNYYTEAVAGAAAKGNAAVAGAFSVDLFRNVTEAAIGKGVALTTYGSQPEAVPGTPNPQNLGVEVSSRSDVKAISFAGAVAGAKKAGVGVSNTDIVNYDETLASIGSGATVKSTGTGAGVKVAADAAQDVANVSVSGAAGTESTGVAGVLGINVSMNKAEAKVADAALVTAEGDAIVKATNDSTMVMVAGGVAGGKEVGVGGAIAVNAVWNRTYASVGEGAEIDAKKTTTVAAEARETAVNAVVAGAGGGKAGVAAALSINASFVDTEASIGQAAKINTDAAFSTADQAVDLHARDDTVVVGIAGGGAGGGKAGVGAALDTTILAKTVKAFVADDTKADGKVAAVQ
ncbi:MAG TPA: hypothetical protein PKD29_03190, partial [Rhodocyclaceae bacterium]|nr:hypothetical protein [Rhodocyclaceae bacterium]